MNEILLESVGRVVGYGGWGVVMMGVLAVVAGMMAGGRRECGRVTLPVSAEREKIARSRSVRLLVGVWGQSPQGLDAVRSKQR